MIDRKGFTLVELMIVVVIIGILAALAVNRFRHATYKARMSGFVVCLRAFCDAAITYYNENGEYPLDTGSGALPSFVNSIDQDLWNEGPNIGGVWDVELNDNGVTSAVGVHFYGPNKDTPFNDPEMMKMADRAIDDGDLHSGHFQRLASDRYYYIIEP